MLGVIISLFLNLLKNSYLKFHVSIYYQVIFFHRDSALTRPEKNTEKGQIEPILFTGS